MTNENKESYYYRAIGTDGRVISISDVDEDYQTWFKELREDLKWSETNVGIMRIEQISVPSQG